MEQRLAGEGFRKLSAKDRERFVRYYDQMNGYWASSLCFADMVAWNDSFIIYWKETLGYMECAAYDTEKKRWVMLPFLGRYTEGGISRALEQAVSFWKGAGLPLIIADAAEWMMPYYKKAPGASWEIWNDRGLCDYLYTAEDFCRYGIEGKEPRYNWKYFQRKYQTETELLTPGHLESCLDFLERIWCSTHQCEECQYGCLKKTAASVITSLDQLNAHGIAVIYEGRIIAYSIVSCYHGLGFFEFKKTERGFRGINEYLHKECFQRFLREAKVINYSEDMGLEGLRAYKSRLAPYTLAPRYELKLLEYRLPSHFRNCEKDTRGGGKESTMEGGKRV